LRNPQVPFLKILITYSVAIDACHQCVCCHCQRVCVQTSKFMNTNALVEYSYVFVVSVVTLNRLEDHVNAKQSYEQAVKLDRSVSV